MTGKTEQWKLTLPCTRAEAEALNDQLDLAAIVDPAPTIVTEEVEAFNDAKWRLVAYFNGKPNITAIENIQSALPSALGEQPMLEKLPDEDWLTLSQSNLQPVHAGRFYVHTATNCGEIPKSSKSFQIEASQAFGTGGHETTSGCLAMVDALKNKGRRFDHIADIGTGTGLLIFAAQHLWPRAYLTATDIDPISIDVTQHNAEVNGMILGQNMGQIALYVAPGTHHEMIIKRAPYDLVIANILAGPLVELAPAFSEIMAGGGTLILAGLLNTQAEMVIRAYQNHGFRLETRTDTGDWPCLCMVKRRSYGWKRPLRLRNDSNQAKDDLGTW